MKKNGVEFVEFRFRSRTEEPKKRQRARYQSASTLCGRCGFNLVAVDDLTINYAKILSSLFFDIFWLRVYGDLALLFTKEKWHIEARKTSQQESDGLGSTLNIEILKIIHVVAHRNKQVEEQLATNLHLHLHGAAALERLPASNNKC
jgi:5-methylcytosine-specific restriction endonuclease McrA